MKKPRRGSKAGLPPGSMVHIGARKLDQAQLRLIEYDATQCRMSDITSLEQVLEHELPNRWLDVHGVHDLSVLEDIGRRFGLHDLTLEDIVNTEQRPKVEDYGDYLFVVLRVLEPQGGGFNSEQISLVLGRGFVLSFQERPCTPFRHIVDQLQRGRGQIRRFGVDYLAYALIDAAVDQYFFILEDFADRAERLEDEIVARPSARLLHEIHRAKRDAAALRRAIWPLREVANTLQRNDAELFSQETCVYMRDVHDHAVHLTDSLETTRDLLSSMQDIYMSSLSNRLSVQMRMLTVITTIFMPLTLITGVFGMNFEYIPFASAPFGFVALVGAMLALALLLVFIFWRWRWLR
jgi:magnesium transporter